jgi:small subunit ribosomal protein S2
MITVENLINAGTHIGHKKNKWNPAMKPYCIGEKDGIMIIDVNKTLELLEIASEKMSNLIQKNKKILFVGTKEQSSEIIREVAQSINMPFITERWLGGLLTNFKTTRSSMRKMKRIKEDQTVISNDISKKERLTKERQLQRMEKSFSSLNDMMRIPDAIFISDINKERIALEEAKKLGIKIFAIADTDTDPKFVDYVIPANDDSEKSISIILKTLVESIKKETNLELGEVI